MRSLLELRRPLMLQAALLASERAAAQELDELDALRVELEGLVDDADDFTRVSMQLHIRIAELSHNEALVEALNSLLTQYQVALSHYPVGHADLEGSLQTHECLLQAIGSKERRQIAEALDAHLGRIEEYLLGARLRFP